MVAGADALVNARHRQWPRVTATIRDVDVTEYHPFTRDGGGVRYSLELTASPADHRTSASTAPTEKNWNEPAELLRRDRCVS